MDEEDGLKTTDVGKPVSDEENYEEEEEDVFEDEKPKPLLSDSSSDVSKEEDKQLFGEDHGFEGEDVTGAEEEIHVLDIVVGEDYDFDEQEPEDESEPEAQLFEEYEESELMEQSGEDDRVDETEGRAHKMEGKKGGVVFKDDKPGKNRDDGVSDVIVTCREMSDFGEQDMYSEYTPPDMDTRKSSDLEVTVEVTKKITSSSESSFEVHERERIEEEVRKVMMKGDDKDLIPQSRVQSITEASVIKETKYSKKYIQQKSQSQLEIEEDFVNHALTVIRKGIKGARIFDEEDGKPMQQLRSVIHEIFVVSNDQYINVSQLVNSMVPNFDDSLKKLIVSSLKKLLKEKGIQSSDVSKSARGMELQQIEEIGEEEERRYSITSEDENEIKRLYESMLAMPGIQDLPTSLSIAKRQEVASGDDLFDEKLMQLLRMSEIERQAVCGAQTEEYQTVDWRKYFADVDMTMPVDPEMKREMDEYIEANKVKYRIEMEQLEAKKKVEAFYKSEDPDDQLVVQNLTVTMKFIINKGDIFTNSYRYFMTIWEIKEDLAGIFRVPPDVILIYELSGKELQNESIVKDLDVEPFQSIELRLQTLDSDKFPLESWHLELPVPDVITVTVETGKDYYGNMEYEEVVVEIIDRKIRKPFIGGFRDTESGVEYHHAFTQSAPHPPYLPVERRNHRDTQTTFTRKQIMDTTCNKATQMWRRDCFITTENDKVLTAQPYRDHEQCERERDLVGKVKTIQRYVRAYIMRKMVKKLSEEYRARLAWEEEQERKRIRDREEKIRSEIVNMSFPKTKADFDMLYAMVERWRKAQVERISKLKSEEPRKAEFCALLEKEIKLLESIETHRIGVLKEKKKKQNLEFMEKVSKPISWTGYKGMTISMDTVRTQRARELKELYESLSREDVSHQHRIEILMSLKYAIKVYNTKTTCELQDLLHRECDLLIRGVETAKLDFLRRRIEHLFMDFFKEADFNPEVAKHMPEYNKEQYRHNVIFCKLCHRMKQTKKFCMEAVDTDINTCCTCSWIKNIAVPRVDLNLYRTILRIIRRDEQKRSCYSSTAFILQEEDVYFLVNNIWHSISAISGNDNIRDLRLPRWDKSQDWTPWNCILLTDVEAINHLKVNSLNTYEEDFIKTIHSKHLLAKNHFKQLCSSDERIRDSGVWANVQDVKKYVPPPITADFIYEETENINFYKKGLRHLKDRSNT